MSAFPMESSPETPQGRDPQGIGIDSSEKLQLELLSELVPPVVHELNNFMAVVRGVLEIMRHDNRDPSCKQAIEVSVAASDLLVRLASYAKREEGWRGAFDPAIVLGDLAPLLQAYTKSKGVHLELVGVSGIASIQGDPRSFWRSLSTLSMLVARQAQVEGLAARMAIKMRTGTGEVSIRITSTSVSPIEREELDIALANLNRSVEGAEPIVQHRSPNAWGFELRLPAVIQDKPASKTQARPKPRVLLLGVGEAVEDELEELFRESGYVLLRPSSDVEPVNLLLSTAADAVLIDARVLSDSSELMLRLVEGRFPPGLGVVLLGAEGAIGEICSLPNPCPPGDLLAAIESVLAPSQSDP